MDSQHFELTEEMLAPKGLRLANYIIDLLAVCAVFFVFGVVLGLLTIASGSPAGDLAQQDGDLKYTMAFIVIYFLYTAAFESFGGRTLGKLITGTIVVTDEGEKAGTQKIALRSLCRFIPFDNFSFLGSVGWHDSISGTRVVKKHIYVMRKNEIVEMDEIGKKSEII